MLQNFFDSNLTGAPTEVPPTQTLSIDARKVSGTDFADLAHQDKANAKTLLRKLLADHHGCEQSTAKLADALDLKPQTIRKRYSETGSYFGIIPSKLPNGRLRWPPDAVERLLGKEAAQ